YPPRVSVRSMASMSDMRLPPDSSLNEPSGLSMTPASPAPREARWHNVSVTNSQWRVALWLGMLTIVIVSVWGARQSLFPFALGAVFAYAITPVVDRLASLLPASTHRADVWRRG